MSGSLETLDLLKWSLFPFTPTMPVKHESLPTHRPRRTLKSNTICFMTLSNLVIYRLHLRHWSRASKSYGLLQYRVGKLCGLYSHDVRCFLSHPLDMCHPVYGIMKDLVESNEIGDSCTVLCLFLMTEHLGISFTERDALRYAISNNCILETASVFEFGLPIANFY